MEFWQNMQKYSRPSWAHFTRNFLNRKRIIDMLENQQPEKYAKAHFTFPYLYLTTTHAAHIHSLSTPK